MGEMKASEFKAKCLQVIDDVAAGRGDMVVTKNGKPLVKLVPYQPRPTTLFGDDAPQIRILGDIISPIDVEWEAERS